MSDVQGQSVIIIGAGAAGLMCAIEAGKRGRKVLLIDHAKAVAEKIRISGGGRCNFTNLHASPANYISNNQYFCVSALKRYTQYDFIDLIERYAIDYHEKTLGQLFCDKSAKQIIEMLLTECEIYGVDIRINTAVNEVKKLPSGDFELDIQHRTQDTEHSTIAPQGQKLIAESVVIATGGPSIPKMGSSDWGYKIARQFGLKIIEPMPALVPLTFGVEILADLKQLSGISVDAEVSCNGTAFKEGLLFTHRGLSGPVILQISSYWKSGDEITINLAPNVDIFVRLKELRDSNPRQDIEKSLVNFVPKRLAKYICEVNNYQAKMADLSNNSLQEISDKICKWQVQPNGTEGLRTAEVTRGGVDTNELSSKTFESKKVIGLYFIGEVVDVTGHLGGYNFQWAWASGHASGQYI